MNGTMEATVVTIGRQPEFVFLFQWFFLDDDFTVTVIGLIRWDSAFFLELLFFRITGSLPI